MRITVPYQQAAYSRLRLELSHAVGESRILVPKLRLLPCEVPMRIRIGVAFALIAAIFVIWSLVEFMPAKMKSRLQPTKNLAIESTFNSRGDAPKSHPEPSSDDTLSPLPWHLVNISREMTLQPAINALSVDIEIDREINDVASLFIVPLNLRCNGQICYFGAMTDNMTGKRPGTNQWEHIGRGFVFS